MPAVALCPASGLEQRRRLAATMRQLDTQIDALTESLLRDGEFVENIAAAQGVSREKIRRFRKDHGIPDTRETRRAQGAPARRPAGRRRRHVTGKLAP